MKTNKLPKHNHPRQKLSIVIPAYNEERNVQPLYDALTSVLSNLRHDFEIIIIDDGSTDRTFPNLVEINKKDKRLRVIRFRRNFGQTAALDAGFKAATGDIIIAMDSDLQNDPRDIPRLLEKMEQGYDVVSGWRYRRNDPIGKKLVSKLANALRKSLTGERIHDSGCSLKAYRKECFDNMNLYGEMHRYIPALLMWRGFRIGEIKVRHHQRRFGKTKYGMSRLMRGFLDLLIVKFWMQYGARPIHLFGGIGILSTIFGIFCGIWSVYLKLFQAQDLSETFLPILAVLSVILGVQFFISGILADIGIKNYFKDTPAYVIQKTL